MTTKNAKKKSAKKSKSTTKTPVPAAAPKPATSDAQRTERMGPFRDITAVRKDASIGDARVRVTFACTHKRTLKAGAKVGGQARCRACRTVKKSAATKPAGVKKPVAIVKPIIPKKPVPAVADVRDPWLADRAREARELGGAHRHAAKPKTTKTPVPAEPIAVAAG